MILLTSILVVIAIAVLMVLVLKISDQGRLKGGVFRIIAIILISGICLASFLIGHHITFVGFDVAIFDLDVRFSRGGWVIMICSSFFAVAFSLRALFQSKGEVSVNNSVIDNQAEENWDTEAEKSADRPKSTLEDIKQAFIENGNVVPTIEQVTDSIQSKII